MDPYTLLGIKPCAAACGLDTALTPGGIVFELVIAVATVIVLFLGYKKYPNILKRYALLATGIFLFEFFTHPMWNNAHLGKFAYVYRDVSWVLTMGWTTMVMGVLLLVDTYLRKWKVFLKFLATVASLMAMVLVAETVVVNLGMRTYGPEVLELIGNAWIKGLNGVPWQIFYYVPVFMALVVSFYRYWELFLNSAPVVPQKKQPLLQTLLLTFVGVFFFELMVEPMVVNANLPRWSYIYRDVSILMSGGWILIIWIATLTVKRFFIHFNVRSTFIAIVSIATVLALPLESWLINHGYRVYGPSTTANFSGLLTPISGIPIEVTFAIPFYLALMVAFARYWEIVVDNKR